MTPPDPISDMLNYLTDVARLIPEGALMTTGPLAGSNRYHVVTAVLREIVIWDHFMRAPRVRDECTACGSLRLCSLQGVTRYPLCFNCYLLAVMEAAEPTPQTKDETP